MRINWKSIRCIALLRFLDFYHCVVVHYQSQFPNHQQHFSPIIQDDEVQEQYHS